MEKSKDTWTVLSSEYLHRAPWLTVRKDHVVLPNGNHIPSYYILEYPNWVNTIAITRDENISKQQYQEIGRLYH